MSLRRKVAGILLILLVLTQGFHNIVLTFASTKVQQDIYEAGQAGDVEFLRRQLEDCAPPEGPLLERSYVVPKGMNLSLADEIWLKIAPLISLGYDEKEIIKAINGLGLPKRIEADGILVSLDYANLHVTRSLEDGEVSVEIPIICNSSFLSVHYEMKGVKKHVKLYNVTSLRYYNISVKASDLYEVAYRREGAVGFSKAMLSLNGDLKDNVIDVYFPNLNAPTFSEVCFNLLSYGVLLSLRVIERKVYDIGSKGKRVDCHWIHVNATLGASRDVFRVMLRIGHGGGWVIKPWLILRKGEYSSDHWIKWSSKDKLVVGFDAEGLGNSFILNFGKVPERENNTLSRVLSEDELKVLLEQPPYERLNLSRAPRSWSIELACEKVTNETVWVNDRKYEQLKRLGWKEGNSLFIDSGEVEWEYAITNKTLGRCGSIKLFYNPLKVKRGELAHGLTLRNYANTNVSYGLRLRTTTSFLFLFSKVEEGNGGITLNKSSISHLLLVQREPAAGDAILELVKDGRIVATVKIYLALRATMYWKGFWDGLATKLPGIMITAGVMVAIGFLIPHAYIRPVYYLLLGIGVLSNLLEVALDIAEANKARDEMLTLAGAFENRSREFMAKREVEHAVECMGLALALRKEVNRTMGNLLPNILSGLTLGVSVDEIRVALGLEEPFARDELERQYKIGYARGRVTGAAISCVLYVALFVMVNRIKVERAGQRLTAGQILRIIARGIYNWITPAIWDAATLVLGKMKGFASRIVDLLLGNKYSREFGEAVGNLLQDVREELPRIGDTLDVSSGLSKHVLENVPGKESSNKILDALGSIIKHYSLNELKEKSGIVVRSIVSMCIKDGDGAIDSLNDWLSINSRDMSKMKALDDVLLRIRGDAAEGVGVKIGDIVDNYFNIKGHSEEVAERFLDAVLKDPDKLEELLAGIECFDYGTRPREVTLKPEEVTLTLKSGDKIGPGTYRVKIEWEYGEKSGEMEFWIAVTSETDTIHIPAGQAKKVLDQIRVGEAKISVIKVELIDFRLYFPKTFSAGGASFSADFYGNELKVNGKAYEISKQRPYAYGGKLHVDVTLKAKNIYGDNPVLSFYDD
ncbi:MAG: hypothetical protein FGF48_05740, partial [Candidatus Brockarchaeota archaeon]|nr:hypothetical protein [Candidatus Brockarchaeota archaeon]